MLNEVLYYLTLLIFGLGVLAVIDYHFVGFIPYLFEGHKLYDSKEKIVCSIESGRIISDCFSKGRIKIRGYFTQTDSKLAVTRSHLYIGKKLVSYHYRVLLSDIICSECMFSKKFKYKISITANINNSKCSIEIDGYAFTDVERKKCSNLILNINKLKK